MNILNSCLQQKQSNTKRGRKTQKNSNIRKTKKQAQTYDHQSINSQLKLVITTIALKIVTIMPL